MSEAKPPKTAILVATDKLSGAQKRAIAIYEALRAQDYLVELWIEPGMKPVLASAYPHIADEAVVYLWGTWFDRLLRSLERFPKLWRWMNAGGPMAARGNPSIERLARARGVELIHLFLELRVAHVKGVKTLFELTSPDIVDTVASWPRGKRRALDAYHAVSPSVDRRFREKAPDVEPIRASGPMTKFRAKDVAVGRKTNTIIFAHRFMARKNAVPFARVAHRFVAMRPDWSVRILGFGDQESEIKAIVADSSDRIEVALIPNLEEALAESRVFVSLIEPDNYPSQSVMESMAAGNALLVSDTGDSVEMFLDGNGLATSLDEEEVLEKLLELTADPERLAAMGAKSRELAEKRFDQGRYLSHLNSVYRRIAAGDAAC